MITPEIIYCFMYTCGIKYLMKTQGNVYKLIFFNGIIGLILSGILQIILSFFNCNDIKNIIINSEFEICDDDKIKTIINNFKSFDNFGGYLALLLIFYNFIEIVCIWLLIFYFSPNHFASIYTIPSFIEIILNSLNIIPIEKGFRTFDILSSNLKTKFSTLILILFII